MSALVQYEPLVNEVIELFLERTRQIYAAPGRVCDFALWLQYFAFDVIGQITYSKQHGFVDKNEDIDGMIAYLGRLFSYVAPVSFSLLAPTCALTIFPMTDWASALPRPPVSQKSDSPRSRQGRVQTLRLPDHQVCESTNGRAPLRNVL